MNDKNEIIIRDQGHVDYLDLSHRYYVVIAKGEEYLDHLYDCHFHDDNGDLMEGYEGFWFDEKLYLLMEKYFFNFIDIGCDLIITMYEEEIAEPDILPKMLGIIEKQMNECDNEEVLELAKQLRDLVKKAILLNTPVGFCF